MSKRRSFSEYSAGDFYLCSDCDAVYKGQQELCEHLAKHCNLRRQARKKICIRRNYTNKDALEDELIPLHLTNDSNSTKNNKLSGIEQLSHSRTVNDGYYLYHQLKMATNTIATTRRKRVHSMKTSLNILHDINVLKDAANTSKLQCSNNLFEKMQSRMFGSSNFNQPPLKKYKKTIKKSSSLRHDKKEMDDDDIEDLEEKETINFNFDSSDFQRFLDANSEIIGRLQAIRKEKCEYFVTKEELSGNKQFTENINHIVQYADLPPRLLN